MGTDYLIDDGETTINLYIQLGEAFAGLGQTEQKEKYFRKAQQLIEQRKAIRNK